METLCFKKPLRPKPLLLAVMLVFGVETVLVDEDGEWVIQDSNSPAVVDNETNEESLPEPSTQPASVQPQPTWDPWIDPLTEANMKIRMLEQTLAQLQQQSQQQEYIAAMSQSPRPAKERAAHKAPPPQPKADVTRCPRCRSGPMVIRYNQVTMQPFMGCPAYPMSWNAADGSGSKGAAAVAKGNGSD